jgi:hypothetical protein
VRLRVSATVPTGLPLGVASRERKLLSRALVADSLVLRLAETVVDGIVLVVVDVEDETRSKVLPGE